MHPDAAYWNSLPDSPIVATSADLDVDSSGRRNPGQLRLNRLRNNVVSAELERKLEGDVHAGRFASPPRAHIPVESAWPALLNHVQHDSISAPPRLTLEREQREREEADTDSNVFLSDEVLPAGDVPSHRARSRSDPVVPANLGAPTQPPAPARHSALRRYAERRRNSNSRSPTTSTRQPAIDEASNGGPVGDRRLAFEALVTSPQLRSEAERVRMTADRLAHWK